MIALPLSHIHFKGTQNSRHNCAKLIVDTLPNGAMLGLFFFTSSS